jgi:uncharacterized protein (DUF302 family)
MDYIVDTNKSFENAVNDLDAAIKNHGFDVLHIHDLDTTLQSKGIEFFEQCKVFEVCNPTQAAKVLLIDMRLNMALPCRISVFTEKLKTNIGLIKPAQILLALSEDKGSYKIATEVDEIMIKMIDEAK